MGKKLLLLLFVLFLSFSSFADADFAFGFSFGSSFMNPTLTSGGSKTDEYDSNIPLELRGTAIFDDDFSLDASLGLALFTANPTGYTAVGVTTSLIAFYTKDYYAKALKLGVGLQYTARFGSVSGISFSNGFLNLVADVGGEFRISHRISLVVDGFLGYSLLGHYNLSQSGNSVSVVSWFGSQGEMKYNGIGSGVSMGVGTFIAGFKTAFMYRF